MVGKQLIVNTLEFYSEKNNVSKKIAKVDELFREPIKLAGEIGDEVEVADLKMHCEIEKQLHMKPAAGTLVFYYNEGLM